MLEAPGAFTESIGAHQNHICETVRAFRREQEFPAIQDIFALAIWDSGSEWNFALPRWKVEPSGRHFAIVVQTESFVRNSCSIKCGSPVIMVTVVMNVVKSMEKAYPKTISKVVCKLRQAASHWSYLRRQMADLHLLERWAKIPMDMMGLAFVVIAYHVELRISENVQNYCIFWHAKNQSELGMWNMYVCPNMSSTRQVWNVSLSSTHG